MDSRVSNIENHLLNGHETKRYSFAIAYGIVKAFIVPRVIVSAAITPWFARVTVMPTVRFIKNIVRKSRS